MYKKIISALMSVVLLILCVTAAFAASDIKITGANYPTTIVEGNTFSVYGTVTSSYKITSLTCAVFNSNGTTQFTKTVQPNAYEYSVHDVDAYMTFSKLKAGSYRYLISATDTASSNVKLLEKNFSVLSSADDSTLSISGATYPTRIIKGDTFSVYGTITSENTITSVTASVLNSSGTAQFSKTVSPNTATYAIHNIDSYMTFSKLSVGTYTYRIIASDKISQNVILVEKRFSVTSGGGAEDGLTPVNWDVIDLSVWNTINSWSSVAKSVDGVILRIGFRGTVNRVVNPDTKFADFYKNAYAQGLHIGAYFFSNALTTNEAVEEAQFVISKLKENKCKMDMPIYFDMETDAQVALSRSQTTEIAAAFCEELEENGYYAGIYCNTSFARDEIDASQLTDYTFWIAHYASACSYTGAYGMWQFSETGSNPGISGDIDENLCYYDYPTYIVKKGLNGYTNSVTPTFTVKSASGASVDTSTRIIYKVTPGLSTSAFATKYFNYSNVTLSYTGTVGGLIATGSTITAKSGTTTIGSYTISVAGDTDSNAKVNSTDALAVLQNAIGAKSFSTAQKKSADYNYDSKINSADALLILQYVVG